MWFYEFFRLFGIILAYPLQLLFFKRKTYYVNKKTTNLKKGGKLIVSNHFNALDYPNTLYMVFPRKLYAVTAEIPFRSRFLRFGMKFFGTIQANRVTRSMTFINESVKELRKEHLVQIFPEGRNSPDGNLQPFFRSYVLIAHRANKPIVPIVSDGNYSFFKRASVIVGEEINVSDFIDPNKRAPSKAEVLAVNDYVYQKVVELRAELEERKKKKRRGEK